MRHAFGMLASFKTFRIVRSELSLALLSHWFETVLVIFIIIKATPNRGRLFLLHEIYTLWLQKNSHMNAMANASMNAMPNHASVFKLFLGLPALGKDL